MQKKIITIKAVPTAKILENGLPMFYGELINLLPHDILAAKPEKPDVRIHASEHGVNLYNAGFTIAEVVYGYSVLCDTIISLARDSMELVSTEEFRILNLTLDEAISAAVTMFEKQRDEYAKKQEIERMGVLAHELRNAVTVAISAYFIIKDGIAEPDGKAGKILEHSLATLRNIVDRTVAEVRLGAKVAPNFQKLNVRTLAEDVIATVSIDAEQKGIQIKMDVPDELEITADYPLISSALSNLLQNAIKYSLKNGTIELKGIRVDSTVNISVEDECGGLGRDKIELLKKPFQQGEKDHSGLGLGLYIVQGVMEIHHGNLQFIDKTCISPERCGGCIFTMILPV